MREKELTSQVIFVRHGQPDFPSNRIYCDDAEDPALTEKGVGQAQEVADFLSNISVAAVYSSPLLRTRMTAEVIAKPLGLDVAIEPDIVERRFGVWEGLFFEEIAQRYPSEFLEWKKSQAAFSPEGGESAYDLLARVKPVVSNLVDRHKGQTIVVVAHVGPIRVLVADALNIPITHFRSLRVDPASIARVDYGSKQHNLIYFNYMAIDRMLVELKA